jgi:hypothetical protein
MTFGLYSSIAIRRAEQLDRKGRVILGVEIGGYQPR